MDVNLVVFRPDGSRKHVPLHEGRYVIGRRADANLRIPLPTVSRDHAELMLEGDRLILRDLGSSNGTYHNNTRIEREVIISAGDMVAVGPCLITVQIDGQPADVTRPDLIDDSDATPTVAPPAQGSPQPSDEDDDDDGVDDLGATVTKPGVGSLLGDQEKDDSSIFDFDFDFDDDDKPASM